MTRTSISTEAVGRWRVVCQPSPTASFDASVTNQSPRKVGTAETMPAIRSDVSGLSSALAASRFAARGKGGE